ncbi:MAG: alginate lyase family protein [Prevotella sp.]|nr:alginate lyase family protein [Prevotella sp.]
MKNIKNILIAGLVCCGISATTTSCRENEFGEVDLDIPEDTYTPIEASYSFASHCAMYTDADFQRVKQSLDNGSAPQVVKDELQNLKNSKYTLLSYTPTPQTKIVRGDPKGTGFDSENYAYAMRDAAAAYQMGMLWRLTGDDRYATKAVEILNAWANTCTEIASNDANQVLAAGAQGYTFANAAGMLHDFSGWATSQREQFKQWILKVFAAKNKNFLDTHTGSNVCAEHYWSNWDLVNMCSYFAIGVLTENSEMVNYVVNYFYQGVGNGCIKRLIRGIHSDPLGTGETICQNQESGRDQGHSEMSMMVSANLAQMAWTLYQANPTVKELDFFAANDNALMKMGEYVALFNLRNGSDNANKNGSWLVSATQMPFTEFKYCIDCTCRDKNHGTTHTQAADDSGRGSIRPGWEILLSHYKNVSGHKYIEQMADKIRPEGGAGESLNRYGDNSGAFDQLGWCTIMLYQ